MKNRAVTATVFLGFALMTGVALADSSAGSASDSPYYRVEDGKVDATTFVGWRLFHNTCVACHGVDATGTDRAPDLTASVRRLSPEEFRIRVLHRYLINVPSDEMQSESGSMVRNAFLEEIMHQDAGGQTGVEMPKWDANPVVRDRIMALYGYLKARSDGALAPGHPEVLKE